MKFVRMSLMKATEIQHNFYAATFDKAEALIDSSGERRKIKIHCRNRTNGKFTSEPGNRMTSFAASFNRNDKNLITARHHG